MQRKKHQSSRCRSKQEEEATTMANLAEFKRLDNKRDLLTDDEYFGWVYLHPEWTAETKQRFTNKRRKEIRARETQVQKDITIRLSNLSNVAILRGCISCKEIGLCKNTSTRKTDQSIIKQTFGR